MHLSCSTSTGFRGVYEKSNGRFEAVYIGVNGDVGVFETALSAAVAYARAVEAASVIAGGAAEPMIQAPMTMTAEETATPIAPAEQASAAGEQPQLAPVTEAEGF